MEALPDSQQYLTLP